MFAVIRTGGKQYRVEKGSVIEIEKLSGEKGESITFDDVLLVSKGSKVDIGTPKVKGAKVTVEVVAQAKAEKKVIFKKIRRHGYHLKKGHRQQVTRVKVTDIAVG